MKRKHSLASNIILFIVILSLVVTLSTTVLAVGITQEEATERYNIELAHVEMIETDDMNYLKELIDDCSYQMNNAHQAAEYLRKMHYSEDSIMIRMLQHDWWMYKYLQNDYKAKLAEVEATQRFTTEQQEKEYPVASTVWRLLKEQGYNDYVCAGIIGNMMIECGGFTLDLDPYAYGSSGYYYGLCQWNRSAYGSIFGADVEEQVQFLFDTIKYELDTFGYCYSWSFDYDSFLNMTDEQDAALAFAKCYERCGSGTYGLRESKATVAYNYFVG
jgi:hypothetical protein